MTSVTKSKLVIAVASWIVLAALNLASANGSLLPIHYLLFDEAQKKDAPEITFPPTPELTPEQRIGAIERISTAIETVTPPPGTPWEQRDLAAEIQLIAENLAASPDVRAVIYENERDLTAIIIMSDGFPIHLFNSKPPRPTPSAAFIESSTVAQTNVAGSKKAVSASYGGGEEIAVEIASRIGDMGYDVQSLGASVEDMAQYKDLGFLYIDSHGGNFQLFERTFDDEGNVNGARRIQDSTGNFIQNYVIETSTKIEPEDFVDYNDLFDDGQLAVSLSNDIFGNWSEAHFGITDKFIERNWSFDNGVVIMHTCYGGTSSFNHEFRCAGNGCPPAAAAGSLSPEPIRQAIISRGASVLMSFSGLTWPTAAAPSMYYFVDRLAGANVEQPQSPDTRAFDSDEVRAEMGRQNLLQFSNGSSLNVVNIENDGSPGLLAPSIKNMDLLDSDDRSGIRLPGQLTLNGDFGNDQGSLELDGLPLSIRSWSPTKIEADVPYVAPGAGEVIVKSKPDIESNPVPLTEWFGTVTLDQTSEGLTSKAVINAQFRADLHKYRGSLNQVPQERIVTNVISPETSGTASGSGSVTTGSVTVTHQGSYPILVYGKTAVDNLGGISTSQSETQTGNVNANSSGDGISEFAASIELDPANNRAEMCMWILGYHDVKIQSTAGTEIQQYGGAVVTGPDVADRYKGILSCVNMTLEDNYTISAGQKAGDNGRVLKWSQFNPVSPPTPDTPG